MKKIIAVLFIFSACLSAETFEYVFTFEEPDKHNFLSPWGDSYEFYYLPGRPVVSAPSCPFIYSETEIIKLPSGFVVENISVAQEEGTIIAENIFLAPHQGTQPMSFIQTVYFEPDRNIYSKDALYPTDNILSYKQGRAGSENLLAIAISPLQYNPVRKKLFFNEKVGIIVEGRYTGVSTTAVPESVSDTDMIIVTVPNYMPAADSLAQLHIKSGINCAVRTTEYINQNYQGRDIQEKIRNCIKYMNENHSASYVLILGNWQAVPGRYCHIEMQSLSEDIPSDHYYSDLDGSWDADNDNVFGEIEDSLDMFPEMSVGRACVGSSSEALDFFNKVKSYCTSDSLFYPENIIFMASYLDANTDGGVAKNYIADNLISPVFTVHRLYESLSNLNIGSFQDTCERYGFSFLNHIGHAGTNSMQCGPDYLEKSDVDNLSNFSKYGIVYSTGCWAAAFDDDCVGWHFVSNSSGGSIGFIGNSRYGWFTPGFPGCGSSEVIDYNYFRTVLSEGENVLGRSFSLHKIPYIALSGQANDYRWIMFALTLFGDPALYLRTEAELTEMDVFLPGTVFPAGSGVISVSVKDLTGTPLEGVIVSLTSAGSLITAGLTDASGTCFIPYNGVSSGDGVISASGANLVFEQVPVQFGDAAYRIQIDSTIYADTFPACNADGKFSSGETLEYSIYIKNTGSSALTSLTGDLASDSSFIGFIISSDTIASVASGGESVMTFIIFSEPGINNGTPMNLNLNLVTASLDDTFSLPSVIQNPEMHCTGFRCLDTISGNGNGFFESGETALWEFTFENAGFSDLFPGQTAIHLNTTEVTVNDSFFSHTRVNAGNDMTIPFVLTASSNLPAEFQALFTFTSGNLPVPDEYSVNLTTGIFGFTDDMEGDTSLWVHSGDPDLWHISSRRYSSSSNSWYCGNESTGQYPPAFAETLETVVMRSGHDMALSFWHWYEVEAGYDYCIVQAIEDGQWKNLATFSGSSQGWSYEEILFDVSADSFNLRFVFYSEDNNNQYEGWYIDDVRVFGMQTVEVEENIIVSAPSLEYSGSFITNRWSLNLTCPENENVNIYLFDVSGRTIKVLHEGILARGFRSFGLPQDLPLGVYFITVEGSSFKESIKLMKAI
ncbi:hypothetical protein JXL83_01745 [candidate division WOR-3 bacterium]|nr:hypothetical protein [candidate division WOR-3 bacterium]